MEKSKEEQDSKALAKHCQSLLEACVKTVKPGEHLLVALCGELLMGAGGLPGFPAEQVVVLSRKISQIENPQPVSVDNAEKLTIGQIKGIEGSPGLIKGFSQALNAQIVVVGRERMIDQAKADHDLPVWTAQECLKLKDLPKEMIVAVSQAKEIFDGVLV